MLKISKVFTKTSIFLGLSSLIFPGAAFSASCDTYPYQPMSNILEFDGEGGFKLLSTAAVPVDFDDPSEVASARREAELSAKRSIAEYINQNFTNEDSIVTEINKSKTHLKASNGSVVTKAQRDEVKNTLSSISARSDAVLKGVMTIGSCYTKGHEVRVTVGIKSKSIANAVNYGKGMGAEKSQAYMKPPANTNSSDPSAPAGVGTKSYDGSTSMQKF